MENMNEKAIETLNHLIGMCNDGMYGYETAAEGVDNAVYKQMFHEYSAQRSRYVAELKDEVRKLGGDPDKGGGPVGALHRTWINIKSVITGKDSNAILNECITGDEAAVKAYHDALKEAIYQVMPEGLCSSIMKAYIMLCQP